MDRLAQGQGGTLNAYWERDGVAWDPGSVTVTVINDAGTALVSSATASGTGTGGRTYVITPTVAASLDLFTIQWTSSKDSSVLTTYAEVVGDYHFTVAYARQRSPLQDTTTYPTSAVLDYRTMAEIALEDICGVAFVPRFRHDFARITSWGLLEVPRRRISRVRAIYTQSEAGPVAVPTLSGLRIMNGVVTFMPGMFNWWSSPVTIAYESGYGFTPPRVRRASRELMRRWLVESPWDERTTGFRTRDGGQMGLMTGSHTDIFDIPEVVSVVDEYSLPMIA